MFHEEEIAEVMKSTAFIADVRLVTESMSKGRIGQREMFADDAVHRLAYFVEAVLASAPDWRNGNSSAMCRSAAEIAETLAVHFESEEARQRNLRLRSALLYDLAAYPAIAQTILLPGDIWEPVTYGVFYRRSSAFIGGTHWIRPGRSTRCGKGLQENHKETSPRRKPRTT
jgi:hypothetical protein